jgi:hypothetical protein
MWVESPMGVSVEDALGRAYLGAKARLSFEL